MRALNGHRRKQKMSRQIRAHIQSGATAFANKHFSIWENENPFQKAINNRDYACLITKKVPHFVLNEARKTKITIFTET